MSSQPRQASASRSLEDELEEALHHPFHVYPAASTTTTATVNANTQRPQQHQSSAVDTSDYSHDTSATTATESSVNNVNNTSTATATTTTSNDASESQHYPQYYTTGTTTSQPQQHYNPNSEQSMFKNHQPNPHQHRESRASSATTDSMLDDWAHNDEEEEEEEETETYDDDDDEDEEEEDEESGDDEFNPNPKHQSSNTATTQPDKNKNSSINSAAFNFKDHVMNTANSINNNMDSKNHNRNLVRNGWNAIAAVGECVQDLEKEMSALLSHHRKQCQVSRRAVSECEDRIKWLQELSNVVDAEKKQATYLRDLLSLDSGRHIEVEQRVREVATTQKQLTDTDFFPLDLEEVRADTRLKKLEDDANELREVMKTLTEREQKSKERQSNLDDRERKARLELDDLDRKIRLRRQQELKLEERERTASRHESAIETWSRTLDVRESECHQRRNHLERCFKALEKAEFSLGLAQNSNANVNINNNNNNSPTGRSASNLPTAGNVSTSVNSHQNDENVYHAARNNANQTKTVNYSNNTTMNNSVNTMPASHLAFVPEAIALNDDEEED